MDRARTLPLVAVMLLAALCFAWPKGAKEPEPAKPVEPAATEEPAAPEAPVTFGEAPMLAAKVNAGELPPVGDRLPKDYQVITPYEQIGEYGGTLRVGGYGGNYETVTVRWPGILELTNDGDIMPSIAKGYEFSDDKTVFTLYLREGLKWSDGTPCTSEDLVFWWEDVTLNETLTPLVSDSWRTDGELMKLEALDDYTVRMTYAEPKPTLVYRLALIHSLVNAGMHPYPKHYLQKWHINYDEDADKLAKEEGFDGWFQAYTVHSLAIDLAQSDLDLPVLMPWLLKEIGPDFRVFERNPYYWAVDPEGNQLPYIDEITGRLFADQESYTMAAISGEFDIAGLWINRKDYPLCRENEAKGGYRTFLWDNTWANEEAFAFNLNNKDPVLREIVQDVRFRQAMSLAMNREEIRDVVFLGWGEPRQAAPNADCSYYKEEWGTAFAEYDPERAGRLLDEMGLKWDKDGKHRQRPDGETLTLMLDVTPADSPTVEVSELVKEYWEAVGVKTDLQLREPSYYRTRLSLSENDVSVWHIDYVSEPVGYYWGRMLQRYPDNYISYANQWAAWSMTDGAQGEEPPEEWKEFYRTIDEWRATPSEKEYVRLAQKCYDFVSDNLLLIGTVAGAPQIRLAKNRVGNFPEKANAGFDVWHLRSVKPAQWFLRQ